MITCTRLLHWDMGHRVYKHEGKCNRLHGHRYCAEVTCKAAKHSTDLDNLGRVIDFGEVKRVLGGFIDDNWDHRTMLLYEDPLVETLADATDHLITVADNPTAENIAKLILSIGNKTLACYGINVVRVKVWETPNCWAEASNDL